MSFFHSFSGTTKQRQINLSQSQSSSSSSSPHNSNPHTNQNPSNSSSYPSSSSLNPSTAQTLLQKAKREKAQRSQARIRSSSALLIQRVWRGWRTRERLAREWGLELFSLRTDLDERRGVSRGQKRREGRMALYVLRSRAYPRSEVLQWVQRWAREGDVLDPVIGEGSYLISLVGLLRRMIPLGISA
jgi:hypothetical protein